MKRILIALALVLTSLNSFAVEVGTYKTAYYDSLTFSVFAFSVNDRIETRVSVAGQYVGDQVWMVFSNERSLKKFVSFITNARDKYIEWSRVAEINGIKSYSKAVPDLMLTVYHKWVTYYGYKRDPEYAVIYPYFVVDEEGKARMFIHNYNTDDERIFTLPFTCVEEFDSFLSLLDIKTIKGLVMQEDGVDMLFQ